MTHDEHEVGDVVVMMLVPIYDHPTTKRVRFNNCYEVCFVEKYEKIRDDIYDDHPLQKEDDDSHDSSTGVLTIYSGKHGSAFDNLHGEIFTLVPRNGTHGLNSASIDEPRTRVRCCIVV